MTAEYSTIEGIIRQNTNNPYMSNIKNTTEIYVVEAVEVDKSRPLQDQVNEWKTYCVCDSRETADNIIQADMERGDILRGRRSIFTIQTTQDI